MKVHNNTIGIIAVVLFVLVAPVVDALAVAPAFYSQLVSPLAQTAARYSAQGLALPSTLEEMDTYIIAIDDDNIDTEEEEEEEEEGAMMNAHGKNDDEIDDDAPPVVEVATFAGGCFWGLELAYQREPGVLATCVGYTQGDHAAQYPTYAQVCSETTGHTEAVLLVFDPQRVTYAKLASVLFDRIPDPTMLNRVGSDRGTQYRTGMYAHSPDQLAKAQAAFDRENRSWMTSGRPVVTEVALARAFWPAEEQHQRYLEKGGRTGRRPQSAEEGNTEEIRCYG